MTITPFDPVGLGFTEDMNETLDKMDLLPDGNLGFHITFSSIASLDREVEEYDRKGQKTGESVEFFAGDDTLIQVSVGISMDEMLNEEVQTDGFKMNTVLRFTFANWNKFAVEDLPSGIRDRFNKQLAKLRQLANALDVEITDENYLAPFAFNGVKGQKFFAQNRHFDKSDGNKGQYMQNFRALS